MLYTILGLTIGKEAMPYTIRYEKEQDYLMVSVQGELDLRLLQNMASDVAKTLQDVGCRRILNDLREARPTRTVEIYNMPDIAKKAGVIEGVKRALVVGEKASDFYFLETVFVNRGHQVKMFADIEEAKEWLLVE